MSPDTYAALFLIAVAVGLTLPSLLVRALTWIEARDRRHDAEDADAFYYPLPDADASDDEFTNAWTAVPFRESETFARICEVLARNEAGREDWDRIWDVVGGEAS